MELRDQGIKKGRRGWKLTLCARLANGLRGNAAGTLTEGGLRVSHACCKLVQEGLVVVHAHVAHAGGAARVEQTRRDGGAGVADDFKDAPARLARVHARVTPVRRPCDAACDAMGVKRKEHAHVHLRDEDVRLGH